MRVLGRVVMLVALWLLAWGEVTPGNVLSGVAVAVALLVAFPVDPPTDRNLHASAVGIARLLGHVAYQLVVSNVVMVRVVLQRHPDVQPGVLAHRLERPSEVVVTVMTNIIALSPGTMTVDVATDASTIYVHFLFLVDEDRARAQLVRLETLTRAAVGPNTALPVPTEEEAS